MFILVKWTYLSTEEKMYAYMEKLMQIVFYINLVSGVCDPVYDPREDIQNAHNGTELCKTELSWKGGDLN